eukprot:gene241-450_t
MNPSGSAEVEMNTTGESQPNMVQSVLQQSSHPGVCIAHFAFKLPALVVYLFGGMFGYTLTFILVTLLLAFDFWTVKNISGRKLVGLRWWNDIKEDGTSEWVFESAPDQSGVNAMDKRIFWAGLVLWPLIWIVFFIKNFFTFQFDNLVLVTMALTFGFSNLVGYWKCSKDAQNKVNEGVAAVTTQGISAMMGRFEILFFSTMPSEHLPPGTDWRRCLGRLRHALDTQDSEALKAAIYVAREKGAVREGTLRHLEDLLPHVEYLENDPDSESEEFDFEESFCRASSAPPDARSMFMSAFHTVRGFHWENEASSCDEDPEALPRKPEYTKARKSQKKEARVRARDRRKSKGRGSSRKRDMPPGADAIIDNFLESVSSSDSSLPSLMPSRFEASEYTQPVSSSSGQPTPQ